MTDQQSTPSRVTWFMLGFNANALIVIFSRGPEETTRNLTAWLGQGWLGEPLWLASPLMLTAILAIIAASWLRTTRHG